MLVYNCDNHTYKYIMDFKIIICSIDDDMSQLFIDEFKKDNKYNIDVYNGDFKELNQQYDCIVSPGNSHGLMDGGIDKPIADQFGHYKDTIKKVQAILKDKHNFKQMPGTATLVKMQSDKCKYILHVPTMIIPMRITNKEVIYWGFYNLLQEVHMHNKSFDDIKKICMSGLGTGAGRVQGDQFVKLIKLAYDHFLENLQKNEMTWDDANRQYIALYKLLQTLVLDEEDIYQSIRHKQIMLMY